MELSDEIRIEASKEALYAALTDPEVLRAAIPGCEELNKTSDNELDAVVALKVGPVKARFKGAVTLDTSGAPDAMSLSGEGKGGAAGFAKGGADVTLEEDGDGTILRYVAKAEVGGKIAQLGSRLIDSFARKMADQFFERFQAHVEGTGAATPDAEATQG